MLIDEKSLTLKNDICISIVVVNGADTGKISKVLTSLFSCAYLNIGN